MTVSPWMQCADCGKIVRVNKPLFGSLHLCLTEEERAYRRKATAFQQQQQMKQVRRR